MKFFYDVPTQVIFHEQVDDDTINKNAGIAYKDEIICVCCGAVIKAEDVVDIIELPWVNLAEELEGDETNEN